MKIRRLALLIPVLLLGVLGAIYLRGNNPVSSGRFFLPCVFNDLTGWHCPGCGMTRGSHHLLNGRVGEAIAMNPLAMLALPFILWWVGKELWEWLRGGVFGGAFVMRPWLSMAMLGVLLSYWVLRNVPVWPLTLLAPGGG